MLNSDCLFQVLRLAIFREAFEVQIDDLAWLIRIWELACCLSNTENVTWEVTNLCGSWFLMNMVEGLAWRKLFMVVWAWSFMVMELVSIKRRAHLRSLLGFMTILSIVLANLSFCISVCPGSTSWIQVWSWFSSRLFCFLMDWAATSRPKSIWICVVAFPDIFVSVILVKLFSAHRGMGWIISLFENWWGKLILFFHVRIYFSAALVYNLVSLRCPVSIAPTNCFFNSILIVRPVSHFFIVENIWAEILKF